MKEERPKTISYDEKGVLTLHIDEFIVEQVFYEPITKLAENEVFGHLVVNLPVLPHEGNPEVVQRKILLKVPPKTEHLP